MLVVDASCLVEVLVGGERSAAIAERMADDGDLAAPHMIDVEVLGVLRRQHLHGHLDRTAATQAVEDLETWPGARYGHGLLLRRAWALRDTIRAADALYVALAEALDAVLLTTDRRLSTASGPRCRIDVPA